MFHMEGCSRNTILSLLLLLLLLLLYKQADTLCLCREDVAAQTDRADKAVSKSKDFKIMLECSRKRVQVGSVSSTPTEFNLF